jgi:transposase
VPAYRWFCRLGSEDAVTDHSSFPKNRHSRFREGDAFRHVFEAVLERSMSEAVVDDDGFAIDASVVEGGVLMEKCSASCRRFSPDA